MASVSEVSDEANRERCPSTPPMRMPRSRQSRSESVSSTAKSNTEFVRGIPARMTLPAILPSTTSFSPTSPTSSEYNKELDKNHKSLFGFGRKKKRLIQQLRTENTKLRNDLDDARRVIQILTERTQKCFNENPLKEFTHIGGDLVQIDCNNTYNINDFENMMDDMELLMEKLTGAFEESTHARCEAETKLKDTQLQLHEVTTSLKECTNLLKNLDSKTSSKLKNVLALIAELCNDRSDEAVLTDGIRALQEHMRGKQLTVPKPAIHAVRRILNKFNFETSCDFANFLLVDIKVCTEIRDQSGLTEECLEILGQWMQQITGDPVKTMCTLVKKFEALRSEATLREYTYYVLNKPSAHENKTTKRPTVDLRPLKIPDPESQYMHFLELANKVNETHELTKEIHSLLLLRNTPELCETL
ncbi:uncharacterized protein LOC127875940 isoform X1 [Dreissena polymorpha]|uniref:uncharacterized protein LOC127875940 isoform X1 n=1 Tax=Dreissena polymorpha TaxID=45954 RepID=UPI002264AE4A|nr:uncharacterized protein LOC127875940 isoform X1 [Dreissena polymorpha]XP_052276659.1 uncharacterized protein LOC127875940 isoform X1 [Dreissena polymorpha]XP_052276660.1 uncharacterized protein LOC127875940 isoform X1 [Dreissena polymorpha]XP_052276661.1 uncharacterized protein LOC127875940 isoform X1 [Dreissena polymorpha]